MAVGNGHDHLGAMRLPGSGGHVKVRYDAPWYGETWWAPMHRPERRLLGHRDDPDR